MNKQKIIEILKQLSFSKEEYWLVTSSALVLYNIGCTTKLINDYLKI